MEKYNSTKLEGVQLQDEHGPFKVWVLHHEDAVLGSNLEMIMEVVFHLLVQLGAHKM